MFVERLTDIAAPPDLVWRIAGEWHECSRSRSIFGGCERLFFLQNGGELTFAAASRSV